HGGRKPCPEAVGPLVPRALVPDVRGRRSESAGFTSTDQLEPPDSAYEGWSPAAIRSRTVAIRSSLVSSEYAEVGTGAPKTMSMVPGLTRRLPFGRIPSPPRIDTGT